MTRRRASARLFVMALAGLLLATEARAEPAPAGLRGKSLVLNWSRSFTALSGNALSQLVSVGRLLTAKIYVSPQGSISSSFQEINSFQDSAVRDANDFLHWRFANRVLVADQVFVRGGRRIVVSFDDGFNTCALDVNYWTEGGAGPLIVRTRTNGDVEETNNIVSSTSCSVQQGNILANLR